MAWEGMSPEEYETKKVPERSLPEEVSGSFAEGVYRGGANLAGIPVDLTTRAMNFIPGVNIQKPVGGSEWLMEQKKKLVGDWQPQGIAGRTAMAVGEQVPNLLPIGRAVNQATQVPGALRQTNALIGSQLKNPLKTAIPTVIGSGLGVAAAREIAPNNPLAEIGGAVLGGGLAGGATGAYLNRKSDIDKLIDNTLRYSTPTTSTKVQGTSGGSIQQYAKNSRNATKELVQQNRDKPFTFKEGNITTQGLPQNRLQFASAIDQMKTRLYKAYNEEQRAAGKEGLMFDGNAIANLIERIYTNKNLPPSVRESSKYAIEKANMYRRFGNMTPAQMEEELAVYNNRIALHGKSNIPSEASTIDQDIKIANILRHQLDKGITKITDGKYQSYRNKYRDIRSMQDSVAKSAIAQLKEDSKKGLPTTYDAVWLAEIMGSVMYGATTGHWGRTVAGVTGGVGAMALKRTIEKIRHPDNRLSKMFSVLDKELPQREYFAGPFKRELGFTTGPYEPEVVPVTERGLVPGGRPPVYEGQFREVPKNVGGPNPNAPQLPWKGEPSGPPIELGNRPGPGRQYPRPQYPMTPENKSMMGRKADRIASIQHDITKNNIDKIAKKEGWTRDQTVLRLYEFGSLTKEQLMQELPNLSSETLLQLLIKGVK